MIQSKHLLYQFKDQPFDVEDAMEKTGLSHSSIRNTLSELLKNEILSAEVQVGDKRKRLYSVNWRSIVTKLKYPDTSSHEIISALGLQKWEGKHIVLKHFQVIDSDVSLMNLTKRFWDKTPDPDIVIITVGMPPDVFTFGFES